MKKKHERFSRALVALRNRSHWSQKRLADAIGVGAYVVYRWEKGDFLPTESNFRRIMSELGQDKELTAAYYESVRRRRRTTCRKNAIRNTEGKSFGDRLLVLISEQMLSVEYIASVLGVKDNAVRVWIADFQVPSRKHFEQLLELTGVDLTLVDLYERNCRAAFNWNVYRQSHKPRKRLFTSPKASFGEALKTARLMLGLRQEDVAAELKLTNSAVSLWETGVSLPEPETFRVLVKVIELPESVQKQYEELYKRRGKK